MSTVDPTGRWCEGKSAWSCGLDIGKKVGRAAGRRTPIGTVVGFVLGDASTVSGCGDVIYQPNGQPCPGYESYVANRFRTKTYRGNRVDDEFYDAIGSHRPPGTRPGTGPKSSGPGARKSPGATGRKSSGAGPARPAPDPRAARVRANALTPVARPAPAVVIAASVQAQIDAINNAAPINLGTLPTGGGEDQPFTPGETRSGPGQPAPTNFYVENACATGGDWTSIDGYTYYRRAQVLECGTHPSGEPDPHATAGGHPTRIGKNVDAEGRRGLSRENEAAALLARLGYSIEQNTVAAGRKRPDYLIEGRIFDHYAPRSSIPRNVANKIEEKIKEGQTERVVLNLADSAVDPDALREQLRNRPIVGLEELIIIDRSGTVLHFYL